MTKIGTNAVVADENKSIVKHLEKDIEVLKHKIEVGGIQLPYEEKTLGFMEQELELKKNIQEVITDNPNKIKADYEYETFEDYKIYIKAKQALATERYMYDSEMEILTKKKMIDNIKETIDMNQGLLEHKQKDLESYK